MDFRDTVSAILPPPRDDEPASLRQDILDELADHLSSSYHRELLRGFDPAAARSRAWEQFGDPAAVARRLWFDAMKGRIMAQRVFVATCVIVMLACCAMVGLFWQRMNQVEAQRRRAEAAALEAKQRMAEALSQAHATNEDIVKQLREMSETMRHPRSPDWNPVRFKLTEETPGGPPVAQASLTLTRQGENPSKTINRMSDASGIADFGSLQPGDYSFSITRGFNEGSQSAGGELNVQPGSVTHKSIVCPKSPPDRVTVRITCAWPPDLEKEHLVLYAPFAFAGRILEHGVNWTLYDSTATARQKRSANMGIMPSLAARSVLCGSGKTQSEILHSRGLVLWTMFPGNLETEMEKARKLGPGDSADVLEEDVHDVKNPSEGLRWELGTYRLNELIVLRPTAAPDVEAGRRRFNVLAGSWSEAFRHRIDLLPNAPAAEHLRMSYFELAERFLGGRSGQASTPTTELPKEFWAKAATGFEVRPGQVNDWTIPLPDELIKAVREALKTGNPPKAK